MALLGGVGQQAEPGRTELEATGDQQPLVERAEVPGGR